MNKTRTKKGGPDILFFLTKSTEQFAELRKALDWQIKNRSSFQSNLRTFSFDLQAHGWVDEPVTGWTTDGSTVRYFSKTGEILSLSSDKSMNIFVKMNNENVYYSSGPKENEPGTAIFRAGA